MDKHSFNKLTQAGWVFYRTRWNELEQLGEIWKAEQSGSWRKHEAGFKSKTALEKRLKEIIQEDLKALAE